MSGPAFYHRTQSQSRAAPLSDGEGIPLRPANISRIERGQRSKSFDNRREFLGAGDFNTSPRAHFAASDRNESVSIPIRREDITVGDSAGARHQEFGKQYRSAVDLNSASSEAAAEDDNEWTSYNRTVKYSHNRTELPAIVTPIGGYISRRHHSSYGYSDHMEPYALRHSDTEQQRRQQQLKQQYQQQQHQQKQQQHQQHNESYYRQSDYDRHGSAYYDEDYPAGADGASIYGRSGAAAVAATSGAGGAGGGTSYRYESQKYSKKDGGGRSHSQHYAANGYIHGSSADQKNQTFNYNEFPGEHSGKSKSKSSYFHYRDASLPATKRSTAHHKVHCCCFSFYWPLWSYEPCAPPTPVFYNQKSFTHSGGAPPSSGVTTQIPPRLHVTPMEPLSPPGISSAPAPLPLQSAPASMLHPNQAAAGYPPPQSNFY